MKKDATVIGLVGAAHAASHLLQLCLPPLFALMREELGVSYSTLGVVVMVFFTASAVLQPVAGFLVDRIGGRDVLIGGVALMVAGTVVASLAGGITFLVLGALIMGIGNSVFHPADYSILNASVDARRIGRGYSVHSVSGNLGWAVAPTVVFALTAHFGWRVALVTVGGLGLVMAGVLATQAHLFATARSAGRSRTATDL